MNNSKTGSHIKNETLIFIPTFNEKLNVASLCIEILNEVKSCDILFVDDSSTDGTGEILSFMSSKFSNVITITRSNKQGVGSAHKVGISYAFKESYKYLVTLDSDFTHQPSDINRLTQEISDHDIVIGSRFISKKGINDWSLHRKVMTLLGHQLTRILLRIPYDASGAFRVYNIKKIKNDFSENITSDGYAFFIESMFIFFKNRFKIKEVPIILPKRTYGESKMSFGDIFKTLTVIINLFIENISRPEKFALKKVKPIIKENIFDPQNWNEYWGNQKSNGNKFYSIIASIYRNTFIKKNLNREICKNFEENSCLLHAGCGSGQVDVDLQYIYKIYGIDISTKALELYSRNNPYSTEIKKGSIFELPYKESKFDGIYNLGVMEHFSEEEIIAILKEFRRVLKPLGKIVIFWPHKFGTSVILLKLIKKIYFYLYGKEIKFHPPELTYYRSKKQIIHLLKKSGFTLEKNNFGPYDLFIQAIIVANKI